jgi:molybdate transport system ATP-binding protein
MLTVDVTVERGAFRLRAAASAPVPGVVAAFGRSGAGKSTLVDAIAGLAPATGTVRLGDTTWLDTAAGVDVPVEQRRIGYVFQDARLFPHLDVRRNLDYGRRRVRGLARYVAFDEVVALLGLEPLLDRRTHALSGGERQRVALGRALLSQPRLLLLDEPLSSLDAARREEVLPYLERLRDRWAIPMVYVSHRYDEVLRLATHVWLLEAGSVVASGTPADTSLDPGLGAALGPELRGTVLETVVEQVDPITGLATLALGDARLRLALPGATRGGRVRLHVPARDVVIATEPPRGLSIRNELRGRIVRLQDEGPDGVLLTIETAGVQLLARVTRAAVAELALVPGLPVWSLVKAASLQGHAWSRDGQRAASSSRQGETP